MTNIEVGDIVYVNEATHQSGTVVSIGNGIAWVRTTPHSRVRVGIVALTRITDRAIMPPAPAQGMSDDNTLGRQLRSRRYLAGLTLKRASRLVGISLSFLSDIERGITQPSLGTLQRLAAFYAVTVDSLLGAARVTAPAQGTHLDDMDNEQLDAMLAQVPFPPVAPPAWAAKGDLRRACDAVDYELMTGLAGSLGGTEFA